MSGKGRRGVAGRKEGRTVAKSEAGGGGGGGGEREREREREGGRERERGLLLSYSWLGICQTKFKVQYILRFALKVLSHQRDEGGVV